MNPDFKTFRRLARTHGLVPLCLELPADLDTPVTVYLKLACGGAGSALLESVEGAEKLARYSFISVSHHAVFESSDGEVFIRSGKSVERRKSADPLFELKRLIEVLRPASLPSLPRFCGGAVGYVAYDMVRHFERLPERLGDALRTPDCLFLLTDECVLFDHWRHTMLLVKWNRIPARETGAIRRSYEQGRSALASLARRIAAPLRAAPGRRRSPASPLGRRTRSNCTPRGFMEIVRRAKGYIRAGDIIQTVLSQRFEIRSAARPMDVYRALRRVNPSPYLYFLDLGGFQIVGSSPEILVRKEGERALTRPIAGTRPRGGSEGEDRRLEAELRADPKERAEHLMLVDLGRNDLGRACRPGTVKVSDFMNVERYSHVMHLVSSVEGRLKPGEDSFSLFKASFPAGTVSGAPKIRAMEIIEELEKARRGTYAGSVGYFSYSGNMDMAITIRTLLFKDRKIYLQAGAGIVADSVPRREEQETRNKARALMRALEMAEREDRIP